RRAEISDHARGFGWLKTHLNCAPLSIVDENRDKDIRIKTAGIVRPIRDVVADLDEDFSIRLSHGGRQDIAVAAEDRAQRHVERRNVAALDEDGAVDGDRLAALGAPADGGPAFARHEADRDCQPEHRRQQEYQANRDARPGGDAVGDRSESFCCFYGHMRTSITASASLVPSPPYS